jgi:serine-type D-Ala-D-Ala carboxypeptidase/endopeptidase (penicillin-binding protein 4)
MRQFLAGLAAMGALLATAVTGAAAQTSAHARADRILDSALHQGMAQAGGASGAYVVDLTAGKPGQGLFAAQPDTARLPASVQKLYTTATALLLFGPDASLSTRILGVGTLDGHGGWHGTLYLRGGGDPTFGTSSFNLYAYGERGGSIQLLASRLVHNAAIKAVYGQIVGDESYFDSLRGTPATGFAPSSDVEGQLSALAFDRGFADLHGNTFQPHPTLDAAQQFASTLRAFGVKLAPHFPISTGRTPASATLLASVESPPIATLIALTNTPSDNFLAETLLKDIGARLGGAGTTAAGAAVVRSELLSKFGIAPKLNDGSGLSRYDATSPAQIVTVLKSMATNSAFVDSLAVGGETGTLQDEMNDTVAQGNCRGKTGTLHDVANLAGYCHARDGHTLAFAFMANGLGNPDLGHEIEAGMAVALAKYDG